MSFYRFKSDFLDCLREFQESLFIHINAESASA